MILHHTSDLLSSGQRLTEQLSSALLAGKKVLWLIPGGSNIPLSVKIMAVLPKAQLPNLTMMLTDERYGAWGHADSNYQQLADAGFNSKTATFYPALTTANASLEVTVSQYAALAEEQFGQADVIIGQFGMGADGHIAGILPNSPAATATTWAAGYAAGELTRMTLTFPALRTIHSAHVFAFGAEKRAALERLQTEVPLAEQPAQIVKEIPDGIIYNDQVEETDQV